MQLILYMMFAIRCFLTNACNCTTLDAAKVDSTFFFYVHAVYFSEHRLRSMICFCVVVFLPEISLDEKYFQTYIAKKSDQAALTLF